MMTGDFLGGGGGLEFFFRTMASRKGGPDPPRIKIRTSYYNVALSLREQVFPPTSRANRSISRTPIPTPPTPGTFSGDVH